MNTQTPTHLTLRYTRSNTAHLVDTGTGRTYKAGGGGYDKTGTVLGAWMQDAYQEELRAIAGRAGYIGATHNPEGLYGMTFCPDGSVRLNGACGESSIAKVARAIGLDVLRLTTHRGETVGFLVSQRADDLA